MSRSDGRWALMQSQCALWLCRRWPLWLPGYWRVSNWGVRRIYDYLPAEVQPRADDFFARTRAHVARMSGRTLEGR